MALEAADCHCWRTAEDRAKEIVERSKYLACLGVVTSLLLIYFLLVASAAVLG